LRLAVLHCPPLSFASGCATVRLRQFAPFPAL
jgi:hypothetical protein